MEIKVVKKVLDANEILAERNRQLFAENNLFVLNVMSSPGAGKTAVLVKTIKMLMPEIRTGVIVGDICTTNDADRLAETGAPVVQINTDEFGGDCHLGANMVEKAASDIDLSAVDLLIVENVGNLVCPAEFDIGADLQMVVLSVTEGEDKPAKYPLMFRVCDAAVINKTDLLPHLDYDVEKTEKYILDVHPGMPIFKLSAKTEEGLAPFAEWIGENVKNKLR